MDDPDMHGRRHRSVDHHETITLISKNTVNWNATDGSDEAYNDAVARLVRDDQRRRSASR